MQGVTRDHPNPEAPTDEDPGIPKLTGLMRLLCWGLEQGYASNYTGILNVFYRYLT